MSFITHGSINGLPIIPAKSLAEEFAKRGMSIDKFRDVANGYRCPVGIEHGRAHILAKRQVVDQIKTASRVSLTLGIGPLAVNFPSLVFLGAERISEQAASDDSTAPYIVELADVRHLLKMSFVNAAYNVRSISDPDGDYYDGTRDSGSDWTWETLCEELWGMLPGAAGAWPTLPFTPAGTPERFIFNCVSAWEAIGIVLSKIGCVVKYDPIADSFSIVQAGETQEGLLELEQQYRVDLFRDSEPIEGNRAKYPEVVKVCFPGINPGNEEEDRVEQAYHVVDYNATDYDPEAVFEANTAKIVFDAMQAKFPGGSSTPDNETELDTRAAEVGEQFYRSLERNGAGRQRRIYRGLIGEFIPGEQVSETAWRIGVDGIASTAVLKYSKIDDVRTETPFGGGGGCGWLKSLSSRVDGTTQVLIVDENDECTLVDIQLCNSGGTTTTGEPTTTTGAP